MSERGPDSTTEGGVVRAIGGMVEQGIGEVADALAGMLGNAIDGVASVLFPI